MADKRKKDTLPESNPKRLTDEELEIIDVDDINFDDQEELVKIYDLTEESLQDVDSLIKDSIQQLSERPALKSAPAVTPATEPSDKKEKTAVPTALRKRNTRPKATEGQPEPVTRLMRKKKIELAKELVKTEEDMLHAKDTINHFHAVINQLKTEIKMLQNEKNMLLKSASEFERKAKEADQYKEDMVRMNEEFAKFHERVRRDREDISVNAHRTLIRDLLPALDSFTMALDAAVKHNAHEGMITGIQLIQKQVFSVLTALGLEKIQAVGTRFDPRFHEAIQLVPSTEYPDNYIVTEYRSGYLFKGKLLRAAMVILSKTPQKLGLAEAPREPEQPSGTEALDTQQALNSVKEAHSKEMQSEVPATQHLDASERAGAGEKQALETALSDDGEQHKVESDAHQERE